MKGIGCHHPVVSPLHADLTGLPPTTIFVGTHEIAHHDAVLFAEKAQSQGCSVQLRVGHKMIHVWPLLPIPEGARARAEIFSLL
jgi:acetyl esterase/lipase